MGLAQGGELLAPGIEEGVGADKQRLQAAVCQEQ